MNNCVWILKDDEWKTECGHYVKDQDTNDGWQFCPWCGEVIKDGENDGDKKKKKNKKNN